MEDIKENYIQFSMLLSAKALGISIEELQHSLDNNEFIVVDNVYNYLEIQYNKKGE